MKVKDISLHHICASNKIFMLHVFVNMILIEVETIDFLYKM